MSSPWIEQLRELQDGIDFWNHAKPSLWPLLCDVVEAAADAPLRWELDDRRANRVVESLAALKVEVTKND